MPSSTPSSESDGTISDHRSASSGVVVGSPPAPAKPPREYICKLCGETFSTHQALGGHVAGHRNKERAAAAAAGMMHHGGRGRKAQGSHVCKECHKEFAKATALGGHMRKHYRGPPINQKNKKRCLPPVAAPPPPPPAVTDVNITLTLFIRPEEPSLPAPPVADNSSEADGVSELDLRLTLAMPSPATPPMAGTGRLRTSLGR